MKLTDLRNLINEEIQYVLNTEAFGKGGRNVQMGTPNVPKKGGKRYMENEVEFPVELRKSIDFKDDFIFGQSLKKDKKGNYIPIIDKNGNPVKDENGKDAVEKQYTLWISKDLHDSLRTRATSEPHKSTSGVNKLQAAKSNSTRIKEKGKKPEISSNLKNVFLSTDNINSSKTDNKGRKGMYLINAKISRVDDKGNIFFLNPALYGTINQYEGLINEVMNALQEEAHNPVDEIGKFFVVSKPKKGMTKEEMVREATVFDDIKAEETLGVYKNKSEANRLAGEALKGFEDQLKEVESSMEEIRKAKEEIKTKAQAAKDKINKIK
jgi:hypothetical protein